MKVRFYWQEGRIEALDGFSVLNANDVLWHKLKVELSPAFTTQRLFAIFANTLAGESSHEVFLPDNGESAEFDLPSEIIRVAGEWTLQLIAREYSTTSSAYKEKGSNTLSFTVQDGLRLDENDTPVNAASISNLYAGVMAMKDTLDSVAERAENAAQSAEGVAGEVSQVLETVNGVVDEVQTKLESGAFNAKLRIVRLI